MRLESLFVGPDCAWDRGGVVSKVVVCVKLRQHAKALWGSPYLAKSGPSEEYRRGEADIHVCDEQ